MWVVEFLKKFLNEGGFTAYLILAAGISLLILAIDRLRYLYFGISPAGDNAIKNISQYVLKRDYTTALQICNSSKDVPELEVVKAGLLAVESGREAMKSSLGAAIVDISKKCEKRTQLIALIASVATLLGLLGTISGLIKTFAAIASADPAKKAELLGLGISEAMVSTAAGLVVGIFAMVVYTLCTSKIDEVVGQSKKTGFNLITLIEQSERD
ncbi:MAG: MotA/TolQ/ExbB proton channel family protein [Pseudobdellovibrionaceae bacterium]